MSSLQGRVALVTGASRGVGKGIALGLGEAGATVYVTGRTVEEGTAAVALPGTIGATAAEVDRLGGRVSPYAATIATTSRYGRCSSVSCASRAASIFW